MIVNEYRLGPHEYLVLSGTGPRIHLLIFTFQSVNAFLVDPANRAAYVAGQRFRHLGPGRVSQFGKQCVLPFDGECFAVIENPGESAVDVAAELTSMGPWTQPHADIGK